MDPWRSLFRLLVPIALSIPAALPTAVPGWAEGVLVEGQLANGSYWHSHDHNYPTRNEAINQAMAHCQQYAFNCRVLQQFSMTCFAMAYSSQGGYGYAFGADEHVARRSALNTCMRGNPYGRCTINAAFCDNVSEDQNAATEEAERQYVEHQRALERQRQEAEQRAAEDMRERVDRAREERAREEREAQEKQAAEVQRAEEERKRLESEAEAKRQEERAHLRDVDDCRTYHRDACERALASPLLAAGEAVVLRDKSAAAAEYATAKDGCKSGTATACDTALASPALIEAERAEIAEWYSQASLVYRAEVAFQHIGNFASEQSKAATDAVAELPRSTKIMTGVAAVLALGLIAVTVRRRPPRAASQEPAQSAVPPQEPSPSERAPTSPPPRDPAPATLVPALRPAPAAQSPPLELAPIDTPAALRALKLAAAYLEEIDKDLDYADEQQAKSARTTLALAAKQLDLAHAADPNAALEAGDVRITQQEIRAATLVIEAKTWFPHKSYKAISIIDAAKALDPNSFDVWFWSGFFNFEQRNRDAAVRDLERALDLEPDNLPALKLHDRAKNLGAAEVALFKVADARDNVAIATAKTINTARTVWRVVYAVYSLGFIVMIFSGVNSAVANMLLPIYLATLIPLTIYRVIQSYNPYSKHYRND